MNEGQLRQLTQLVEKAEELRDADLSPQVCIDDAMKQSMRDTQSSEPPPSPNSVRSNPKMIDRVDYVEEIDAFFARFSIQNDSGTIVKNCQDNLSVDQSEGTVTKPDGTANNSDCPNVVIGSEENCLSKLEDFSNTSVTTTHHVGESVSHAQLMEEAVVGKLRRFKPMQILAEGDNNLPKHLGLWKSPWQRNHPYCTHGSGIFQHDMAAGIVQVESFCEKTRFKKKRQCLLSLEKRTVGHTGYLNVDFYSLYESTVVQAEEEDIDQAPWEYRDVGQRFLHEKSLESRNWFGQFELQRGNDRIPNPVCCPKSLEVSVTKIPDPGEWSEDWFTTWKSRKDNPNNLIAFAQDDSLKRNNIQSFHDPREVCDGIMHIPKKVAVEIGFLCPVRVKGGERISRIHPAFTSSLRQSRWRKKYLKGSMFPVD